MTQLTNKLKNTLVLTPVFGILLFFVLYFIAALLYPGGSQFDKNAVGFSWVNNYWCNLLYEKAINGQHNPAQPFAMAGMFILSVSLSFFWFLFPKYIPVSNKLGLATSISGALAMAIAFFLFTDIHHDFIINLASVLGLVAMAGTFIGLYKAKWFGLFAFGFINILLVGLNNYVYHTEGLIVYLPIVQKISFASFLIWICCININIYRVREKRSYQ